MRAGFDSYNASRRVSRPLYGSYNASRRVRNLPLLALLALASVVLLLSAHSFAEGQPAQRPVGDEVDGAEHDAGDHTLDDDHDEEDLLKGIIGEHGDDDEHGLEEEGDDMPGLDDFDLDEDGDEGVDMHNFGDHTGSMSPDEEKIWKEDEEKFFNAADESKDGYLDEHEYVRAMMKEMDPNVGHSPDAWMEGETPPPPPSAAISLGTGALTAEGMTEDEKMHFEELGQQFKEEDLDKDGKISLEEWMNIMFHDEPQEPEFEEGMEGMMDRGQHHELTAEEQAEMMEDARNEFNQTDLNSDGKLSRDEMLQFVKGPGIQEGEDDGDEPISPGELESMAKELFGELDRDKDESVSFDEFYKAHYMEPPHENDFHDMHPDDDNLDVPDHDNEHGK